MTIERAARVWNSSVVNPLGASPDRGSDPSKCVRRRRHGSSDCTMSLAARRGTRRPLGIACFAEGAGPERASRPGSALSE